MIVLRHHSPFVPIASSPSGALTLRVDRRAEMSKLPNLSIADEAAEASRTQIEEISRILENETQPTDSVEERPDSATWQKIKTENKFQSYTNFSENALLDLLRAVEEHEARFRKRGPRPKVATQDGFLMTIIRYSTGLEYDKIGGIFGVPGSTAQKAIDRMRPILHSALTDRWLRQHRRPVPLLDTNYPHIGLLVDTTSLEVFRPKARFEEAKAYWDHKNGIYALKKEVGVMAAPPHYALFFTKGEIGSKHDYSIFKETYTSYLEYLAKTTEEIRAIPTDSNNPSWAVLLDRAYIGPQSDTPNLRKITPKKSSRTASDRSTNVQLDHLRTPVECFFGRMNSLWATIRNCYRWSHEIFDADFENCALLTNQHIDISTLAQHDMLFYRQLIASRTKAEQLRQQKVQTQKKNYHETKKRRTSQ